ncbi:MAG TPA: serine/threonine-protein kinase [Labilithrix sp.]
MPAEATKIVGRYAIYGPLAAGGMATVHLGRLVGPIGFARIVAVKRMRSDFLADPELVARFVDEARISGRIKHPNIVAVNDVVATADELLLVMEYVHGETLARLGAPANEMPAPIAAAIVRDALLGLHAAHEAKDEHGTPLGIIHRDVSPQNVIVGVDGVARVLDFGVAKAIGRSQVTREGHVKGKLSYMAPEQLTSHATQSSDTFAAAVVLWEALTGESLFRGDTDAETVGKLLSRDIPKPSKVKPELGTAYDDVVMKALARLPPARYASAKEMATALGRVVDLPDAAAIGEWVAEVARDRLAEREALVAAVESSRAVVPSEAPTIPAIEPTDTRFDAETKATAPVAARGRALWFGVAAAGAAAVVGVTLAVTRLSSISAAGAAPSGNPEVAPSASVSANPIATATVIATATATATVIATTTVIATATATAIETTTATTTATAKTHAPPAASTAKKLPPPVKPTPTAIPERL